MCFYSNALILLLKNNLYNVYTFDKKRDYETFSVMNKGLIKVPFDNVNNVIVPIQYDMTSLMINQRYHNRIYLI